MEKDQRNLGFCPDCGSILPHLKSTGGVICYLCEKEHDTSGKLSYQSLIIDDYYC